MARIAPSTKPVPSPRPWFLRRGAVLLGLLLLLGLGGLLLSADSLGRWAIERETCDTLGVPASLESLELGLWQGQTTLKGLTVANPEGFHESTFLTVGQIQMAMALGSLMSDRAVIPRLDIHDVVINLEHRQGRHNIGALLEKMKEQREKEEESSPWDDGEEQRYTIDHLRLHNVLIQARFEVFGQPMALSLPIDRIELQEIGERHQGVIFAELLLIIADAIAQKIQPMVPFPIRPGAFATGEST